jgi:outer membrane protein TolC
MLSGRSRLLRLTLLCVLALGCRVPAARPVAPQADSADERQSAGESSEPERLPEAPVDDRVIPASYQQDSTSAQPPLPADSAEAGKPLSLDEAIGLALAANPDLDSASAQIAIADATLARARAEFYPKLGASQQYAASDIPVNAFSFQLNQARLSFNQDFNHPGTIDNFQTQLRLEHRLYAGQRRQHALHAAQQQVGSATLTLAAVQNQLVYQVAEAYYRLLQARDLVNVRQQAVSQVEEHLKIVESRFRNETAVKSDVLTVEVRLAEVREALIFAQNQFALAWAVLENVSGRTLDTRGLPTDIPAAPWNDHAILLEAAVNEAFNSRPEVGALAGQRRAAAEGVLMAEADKKLAVDVLADYDVYTGDFRTANDGFFVGLVFQLNLFDGGRTGAEVERALSQVRELQARQRRLMLDIELDVRRAYLQLHDAEARLEVASQAIGQADEGLRVIEVRYQGQTATITELVDAQVALSNAQVRRTTAQADVEIARAALERAVGRLTGALGR